MRNKNCKVISEQVKHKCNCLDIFAIKNSFILQYILVEIKIELAIRLLYTIKSHPLKIYQRSKSIKFLFFFINIFYIYFYFPYFSIICFSLSLLSLALTLDR